MMQIPTFRNVTFTVLVFAVLFAGCRGSAPRVEYYSLNAPDEMSAGANTAAIDKTISIGVGPVQLPESLDRPQIVTRTGPNKLYVDDFHRWAGRLKDDFAMVLAQNISFLLVTNQVAVFPWDPGFKPQYQVALDIRHFEGQWGQDVLLEVFWRIIEPQNQKILRIEKTLIKEPLPGNDYEALVSIKSRAVTTLGRKIVDEIRSLQAGRLSTRRKSMG